MTKLFLDDIRPAPDGWCWARTADAAREQLRTGNVETISLDFDLGLHHIDLKDYTDETINMRGFDEDNGFRLVEWMVANDLVPKTVIIHSWNTEGARRMYLYLNEHGYDTVYEAYSP